MRRADRLFQIIQILRRRRGVTTAQDLATELETSVRSVYRDIAALMAQRVPIRGEAGIGYVLDGGFDLPPLMLTADEIEAAVLGAQWVAGRADPELARAARDLIAKIAAAVPPRLRDLALDPASGAPPQFGGETDSVDVAALRAAIRAGRKVTLTYRDERGAQSLRTVWPLVIGYFDAKRMLVGWCELRTDFRNFRIDRVVAADVLETKIPERPAALRARWRAQLAERRAAEIAGQGG